MPKKSSCSATLAAAGSNSLNFGHSCIYFQPQAWYLQHRMSNVLFQTYCPRLELIESP
jgi:hypothetical protein